VPKEIRKLIRQMSRDNPLWGAPRIHGELLKQAQSLVTMKFRGETDEYINTMAQKYRKLVADLDTK
jgi:hypothetical protein